MGIYLGCDLGTSGLKVTLVNDRGDVIRSLSCSYPLLLPKEGYSEQNPIEWFSALRKAVKDGVKGEERKEVRGISISGQMHGLVALDSKGVPLRNAILWNDSRSTQECAYLNATVGEKKLMGETGNIAFPGFTLPKILWMKNNEPSLYRRIAHVLLPKDYLVYRLCGVFSTDYSDASGTLVLDVRNRKWSKAMIKLSGLPESAYPPLRFSQEKVGCLSESAASELGLSEKVFVLAGSGDNAAGALGDGVVGDGQANISLGTSGTIFLSSPEYHCRGRGSIHSFLAADGSYCLLSCALSSASSLKWLMENVLLTTDYAIEQRRVPQRKLGRNSVYFLPYLMGERSPINDPFARGAFLGMSLDTKRGDMALAVMEGVAFSLRQSYEAMKESGAKFTSVHLTGGGATNPLWRRILANVLKTRLGYLNAEAGASYGMGLLCLVSEGILTFQDLPKLTQKVEIINPSPDLAALYEDRYQKWKLLYPALRGVYKKIRD